MSSADGDSLMESTSRRWNSMYLHLGWWEYANIFCETRTHVRLIRSHSRNSDRVQAQLGTNLKMTKNHQIFIPFFFLNKQKRKFRVRSSLLILVSIRARNSARLWPLIHSAIRIQFARLFLFAFTPYATLLFCSTAKYYHLLAFFIKFTMPTEHITNNCHHGF